MGDRGEKVVLLSPHHDDETLFAAFQILRMKPYVVVCTKAIVQDQRGYTYTRNGQEEPICSLTRHLETADAMNVLDVDWEEWSDIPDTFGLQDSKHVALLGDKIDQLAEEYYFCIAPAYAADGHEQHNIISVLATSAFPPDAAGDRLIEYTTYTKEGRSRNGHPVPFEPHWPALKMRALACYESQIQHPSTRDHFMGDLWEWQL